MRYFPAVLIALILLTGCAGQKVFTSNGVSYFSQPARELTACYKFTNAPVPGAEISTVPLAGKPLSLEQMIYFPVETNYLTGKERQAFTTVYAIDQTNKAVRDSLVLKQDGKRASYRHLAFNKDLYLVGIQDTLLHIIRVDKTLKIQNEYNPGLRFIYLADVSVYDGRLRVVGSSPENDIIMYDIKTDTMQPERKRLLVRNFDHYDMDGNILWYFSADEKNLTTARMDLTAFDPTPVYKTFELAIPKLAGYQVYNTKAAGNTIFLSWSWFTDDAKGASKLVAIEYDNGKIAAKEVEGNITFDVQNTNSKTYMFRTALLNKKQALMLTEIKPDLTESAPAVTFFLAEQEFARGIQAYGKDGFILTGAFNQKTGKKILQDMGTGKPVKVDEAFPQPFLSIFSLE